MLDDSVAKQLLYLYRLSVESKSVIKWLFAMARRARKYTVGVYAKKAIFRKRTIEFQLLYG